MPILEWNTSVARWRQVRPRIALFICIGLPIALLACGGSRPPDEAYTQPVVPSADAPLRPGDVVHVNLYWEAPADPSGDWQVKITLVAAHGNEWGSIVAEPAGAYPTSSWQAGDVWRGQFNLALPADAPEGRYRLRVGLVAPDGATLEPFLSEPLEVEQ